MLSFFGMMKNSILSNLGRNANNLWVLKQIVECARKTIEAVDRFVYVEYTKKNSDS